MHVFMWGCWGLLMAYGWVILRRWYAWLKMPVVVKNSSIPQTYISVIIPVRNEAQHILALLQDLEQQTYTISNFEVIVIDDHSEDETASLIQKFKKKSDLPVHLISLQDYPGRLQKKAAITTGITVAKGQLMVQTDGDCRVTPNWLFTLAQYYEQTNVQCIAGPVALLEANSLFTRMQVVEFASLIGVGGASIALGKPNMCNGANLAYTRQAFIMVQGFAGNEQLASGDDEFLMHKIAKSFPGQIAFLKSPETIVRTAAQASLSTFMQQRIRWASKWPNYSQWHIKLLALLVFGVNLGLFSSFFIWLCRGIAGTQVVYLYFFKFLIDSLFLVTVLRFLYRKMYIAYLIPLQFVYIPYVLYTALLGLRGTYNWKSRRVKK
ncbi:glycosyltransferase [Adhaeribacter pallidiroseus]|uniref:Dolichyl-phosphate beta-D-mannosyltransferase n=1 Tax=Adhaeribacter pallidiroseus TaxID=2072847 RepID=A0A369QGC0_9BACT|nr:glycosyltransferase [Adhaeribacter pallidiroseus]RDC63340.1 Dolichyl-phosphate beta-D-mannosyltransferase [Adhaeribacter pallidiroseus]